MEDVREKCRNKNNGTEERKVSEGVGGGRRWPYPNVNNLVRLR